MTSFLQAFLDRVQTLPSAPAVSHPLASRRLTSNAELLELTQAFAASLSRLTPPGAFVPIYANKSAESIACSLACVATGRPFAWLNKRLRAPQIAEVVAAGGGQFIVADAPGLTVLGSAVADGLGLSGFRWLGLADTTPAANDAALVRVIQQVSGIASVETLQSSRPRQHASMSSMGPDEWACCLFTSGSTGRQKGVMISAGDLTRRAQTEAEWFGLDSRDRLLSILPFSFDVGLNQLMSALMAGACLVIQESWLPKDWILTMVKERITGISGVPAIWRDLLAARSRLNLQEAGQSLRYITISGGSLSLSEQTRLQTIAKGVDIFKTYGQTETFRSASLRPEDIAARGGSVGRAYPGTRVLILDDALRPCPPGEVGEVVHVGAGTMMGYLGEESSGQKLRLLPDALGGSLAVFTGDYGYLDAANYLFLKGRRDNMVKIAGHRVYPEEAADQLRALPAVREAEVIAIPTEAGEFQLVAFVVADGQTSSTASVRRAVAERVPAHMVPAQIVFQPAIPRLSNGKPDYKGLTASRYGTPESAE